MYADNSASMRFCVKRSNVIGVQLNLRQKRQLTRRMDQSCTVNLTAILSTIFMVATMNKVKSNLKNFNEGQIVPYNTSYTARSGFRRGVNKIFGLLGCYAA
jgi:hypothetical protein